MGFPRSVADEVFVRCRRHCCLCGKFAGKNMELHHIKQKADGGDDTIDNCIPLCLDCHADVKSFNPHHPKGRPFSEKELKGHRDKIYAKYDGTLPTIDETETNDISNNKVFPPKDEISTATWGYPGFDALLPLLPGKMVLVAGHTGSRKSTYLYHIINSNLLRNQRIALCCMKDRPFEVGCDIIAEASYINSYNIKTGQLTEEDWKKIAASSSKEHSTNLALLPPDKLRNTDEIINVIDNSGAEIVVIDDLNGLLLDSSEIERFMYQLKSAASRNNVIVFAIFNLTLYRKRVDMRPILEDFPSDNYYRLFDIVQFLFRPSVYYQDSFIDKNTLELITVKGTPRTHVFNMYAPDQISSVIAYDG